MAAMRTGCYAAAGAASPIWAKATGWLDQGYVPNNAFNLSIDHDDDRGWSGHCWLNPGRGEVRYRLLLNMGAAETVTGLAVRNGYYRWSELRNAVGAKTVSIYVTNAAVTTAYGQDVDTVADLVYSGQLRMATQAAPVETLTLAAPNRTGRYLVIDILDNWGWDETSIRCVQITTASGNRISTG